MLQVERLFRRLAYTFGIALLVTSGFIGTETQFYVPTITWVVAVVLFLFSWRIQKEYNNIIVKLDGADKEPSDPIAWVAGDKPHVYHFIWAAIYTFGTYIVVMLPIDWFLEGTREWRPYFIAITALLFFSARLVDPKVRPSFYNKKS